MVITPPGLFLVIMILHYLLDVQVQVKSFYTYILMTLLLLVIDDDDVIDSLKCNLSSRFSMKDLGLLRY